jgi:hypothetical protein
MLSSLSMGGRGGLAVHRLRDNCSSLSICVLHDHHGHSYRVTITYAVYIQFDLMRMSIILLETCRVL